MKKNQNLSKKHLFYEISQINYNVLIKSIYEIKIKNNTLRNVDLIFYCHNVIML